MNQIYSWYQCGVCKRIEIFQSSWWFPPFVPDEWYWAGDLCEECAHYAHFDWRYEGMQNTIRDTGDLIRASRASIWYERHKQSRKAAKKHGLKYKTRWEAKQDVRIRK